ncbi:hypothetical protein ACHAW5_004195 [Stephanodiscus triporus]|uniref:Uncharacterized protein n=1 Tax=Stephanodiscus triporus TaxID=2934178 RepID=A0ABD3PR57_9STRA
MLSWAAASKKRKMEATPLSGGRTPLREIHNLPLSCEKKLSPVVGTRLFPDGVESKGGNWDSDGYDDDYDEEEIDVFENPNTDIEWEDNTNEATAASSSTSRPSLSTAETLQHLFKVHKHVINLEVPNKNFSHKEGNQVVRVVCTVNDDVRSWIKAQIDTAIQQHSTEIRKETGKDGFFVVKFGTSKLTCAKGRVENNFTYSRKLFEKGAVMLPLLLVDGNACEVAEGCGQRHLKWVRKSGVNTRLEKVGSYPMKYRENITIEKPNVLYIKFGRLGLTVSGFFREWKLHYQATREAREKKKAYKLALEASQTRIPDYFDWAQTDPTSTIDLSVTKEEEDEVTEVAESPKKMPATTTLPLVPEITVDSLTEGVPLQQMYTHSSKGVLGHPCDASELISLCINRCSDMMQVADCFVEKISFRKLNGLLDDLDLPRLDGHHDLRTAKFNLCKDEFLRVTQLPDIKPRTGRQAENHRAYLKLSDEQKEKKRINNKAQNDAKKAPCKRCGQSCVGEFAQVVTLPKKDGSGTFQHVFCKTTCSRITCFGKCIKCGQAAGTQGKYTHKDSDKKVVKYRIVCGNCRKY